MNYIEIDVRGLSCPEPVMITMDAMDANKGKALRVICDEAHTKANIEAMAKSWYEVRDRYDFSDWKKAFKKNRRGPMTMSSTAANSWKQYFAQCAGTIALGEVK